MPIVPISLITNTILGENAHIPSPSVDYDSQSDLLLTVKDIEVELYNHLHNFLTHAYFFIYKIVVLFSLLILILFPSSFHMSCQIQVGWKYELHALEQNEI